MVLTPVEGPTFLRLPIKEQATTWVGWLRDNIQQLSETPNIDTNRAIRGIIVRSICLDSINSLRLSVVQAAHSDDKEDVEQKIRDNLDLAWFESSQSIEEFGPHLPDDCLAVFNDLLNKYKKFRNNVIDRTDLNREGFILEGNNIFHEFKELYRNPPGMTTHDVQYALDSLNP